jgi:outer membrane immunogenic protein
MKKFLLSAVAILSFGSFASAADLPAKTAAPAVMRPACAAAQFQGLYIGISGGGVKHIASRTDQDAFLNSETSLNLDKWGGIIGGTLGYNFARCNTLWGVEIDGSWTSVSNSLTFDPNVVVAAQESLSTKMQGFGTARFRGGVVVDDVYFYGTGGFAVARFRTTFTDLNGGATPFDNLEQSQTRWGWTAGVGAEWAFARNWTLKSEVLYANFTDRSYTLNFPAFGPASFTDSDQVWVSRIGLNYRFGW